MFFENEIISFNILDVLTLKQDNVRMNNSGRNFSALSFRLKADTVLISNGKEYEMKDNTIAFVPANLDYERVSNADELIVIHFDIANHCEKNIDFFVPENKEKLKELFLNILQCWNKKETGYKFKCSAMLYEILALCYKENYKKENSDSKIRASVDYIKKNFKNTDISIKRIAEKSFISEVYFRKLFKKEYGISPQKYIINLRIQNAVQLISTGYYSLKEVAVLSGYTDYKYFSVEFKKQTGVSPSEYVYNYLK